MKYFLVISFVLLFGCTYEKYLGPCQLEDAARVSYTVSYDPYSSVAWGKWVYCLSQHHDHIDTIYNRVKAYDEAGYNALSLMHYAGNEANNAYRKQRIWPFDSVFRDYDTEGNFLRNAQNLKLFIPAMEEVGFDHVVSPFLTKYIARSEYSSSFPGGESLRYASTQGCLDMINQNEGYSIIAHPTLNTKFYLSLRDFTGIEIYNAYYQFQKKTNPDAVKYNDHFLTVWDQLLRFKSTRIWGFAVNDHFGPYNNKAIREANREIFDSGKIMVLTDDYTLEKYKESINQGAFYAIHDFGIEKNKYPKISGVTVDEMAIEIESDADNIQWVFCSQEIATGSRLDLTSLPKGMNYVRAVVSNTHGKLFLQPFSIEETH